CVRGADARPPVRRVLRDVPAQRGPLAATPAPGRLRRFSDRARRRLGETFARRRHSGSVDRVAAEDWIGAHVAPIGAIETAHERPWSTVLRVPLGNGVAWFKACSPAQAFEPRLTAELFARWPDRMPEVLAHDEERAWLLLADAGTPMSA